jgi:hypothetical protein
MPNPIYNLINKNSQPDITQGFADFMHKMQGQNPDDIINQLVSSGKINQAQLNQAQAMAQQMQGRFSGFRKMFGF